MQQINIDINLNVVPSPRLATMRCVCRTKMYGDLDKLVHRATCKPWQHALAAVKIGTGVPHPKV